MPEYHSNQHGPDKVREKKKCEHCLSKVDVIWVAESTDLEPQMCPFCGYDLTGSTADEDEYNENENEDNTEDGHGH